LLDLINIELRARNHEYKISGLSRYFFAVPRYFQNGVTRNLQVVPGNSFEDYKTMMGGKNAINFT